MPTLLSLTSLTWDAISSREAEQAWVLLLDWGRVHTACTVPFSEPFLRTYCLLCSGWDQSPQRDQELEDLGGNKHLASMSPGASVPNSSLPESAASWAPQHPQQAAVVLDETV